MPKKANIFESFSHSAIQQFKEAFGIMDTDKDGLLSSSDLVAAFAAHGKSIGGGDAQVKYIESYENYSSWKGIGKHYRVDDHCHVSECLIEIFK